MIVTAGTINVSVYFYIVQDASNTSPGEPLTGLLFSDIETGGSASYMRQGAARTDFTLVTLGGAAVAHEDGGFIEVDATNMPGVYRCDVPDAAFATGVDQVIVQLVVAAAKNAVVAPLMIDIADFDVRDSNNNLSASDVNAQVLDVLNTDTFAIPGQEAPAATTTLIKMWSYIYKAWRNKSTQTSTEYKLFADDATTVDQKSTVGDDGTTFTSGEVGTGP